MVCSMCGASSGALKALESPQHIQVASFLSGNTRDVGQVHQVCSECWDKINVVAGFQQSMEVKAPPKQEIKEEAVEDVLEEDEDILVHDKHDPEYKPGAELSLSSLKSARAKKPKETKEMKKVSSTFQCPFCSTTLEKKLPILNKHFTDSHGYDPVLAIEGADFALKHEDEDSKHEEEGSQCGERESHEGEGKLICRDCEDAKDFPNIHSYIRHLLLNHVEGLKARISCKHCDGQYFLNASELKIHLSKYHREDDLKEDKLRKCQFCTSKFRSSRLKGHQNYVHLCKFCDQTFVSRGEKLIHLKEIHYDSLIEVCDCGMRFEFPGELTRHKKAHHSKINDENGGILRKRAIAKTRDDSQYKFQCDKCPLKFKSKNTLKGHVTVSHDPNRPVNKCPFCEFSVPKRYNRDLYKHMENVHPEQKEYIEERKLKMAKWKEDISLRAKIQCYLCQYASTRLDNLSRHYADAHGYDKELAENPEADPDDPDGSLCPECGEHFMNKHSQIKHLIKIHSHNTGDLCLYCNFRYLNLENHIEMAHKAEKEASIQYCKKCVPEQRFPSFDDLLRHTRSYHRKVLKSQPVDSSKNILNKGSKLCENCGKTVKDKLMGRHRSECPKRKLDLNDVEGSKGRYIPIHLSGICPYCSLKYSDLLGHLRFGHKEEKHSEKATHCTLCSEKFNSVRELVTHRQLHPTFGHHTCYKCKSSTFETIVDLRKHQKESCPKRKKTKNPSSASNPDLPSTSHLTQDNQDSENKTKPPEYEGRGTVSCALCEKSFTMKNMLRRHFINHHDFKPDLILSGERTNVTCETCNENCFNRHAWIKHQLDYHAIISGDVCPYCDHKWGLKKFDNLDEHVEKYHYWESQYPIQECSTCKSNFSSYDELKKHRQIHYRKQVELKDTNNSASSIMVHSRVAAIADISNRGGVKCLLCSAFKLRKDHLRSHYQKHHGYEPKLALDAQEGNAINTDEESLGEAVSCPSCHKMYQNNHYLIKHLLKDHCNYSGLICPYCKSHHPERYIDLQTHVTQVHIDKLTGYNVDNACKVCKKKFSGYAELRDHVQSHGNAFREPYGNPDKYREYNKKRRKIDGKLVPFHNLPENQPNAFNQNPQHHELHLVPNNDQQHHELQLPAVASNEGHPTHELQNIPNNEDQLQHELHIPSHEDHDHLEGHDTTNDDQQHHELHNTSISSTLLHEIFNENHEEEEAERNALALEEAAGDLLLDESTTANDTETEEDLMQHINDAE